MMSGKTILNFIAALMLLFYDTAYPDTGKCVSGNCKNGTGTLTIPDKGLKYTGQFKNGQYHGKGTLVYDKNGYSEYTGEFQNGQKHGKGILKVVWGVGFNWTMKGTWEKDKVIYAEHTVSDGTKYVGSFKNGNREGKGILTQSNGDRYEGEFNEHYTRGKGTWYYKNGTKYVGGVNEFGYHGEGTLYNADGSVKLSGTWHKGVFKQQSGQTTSGSGTVSYNPNSYPEQDIKLSELPEWKWQYADGQGKYHYLIHQEKCPYGLELEQWYQDRGFVSTQYNYINFCGKKMPPGYQVFVKPVLFIWGKQWTAAEIAEKKRRIEEAKKSSAKPAGEKDIKGSYCWENCVKSCWSSYKLQSGQEACVKSCKAQCSGK